ncbi:MAG: glyoxalase superfamily protein [Alphaproteobacteria bacterium]
MEHHDPFDSMKRYAKRLAKQASEDGIDLKHREALAQIAKQIGFNGWSHAVHVIEGKETQDYGTLLYGAAGATYPNIWEADLARARAIRQDHGGILLPYKTQFLIVEPSYLAAHDMPAELPEWQLVGRDWTDPQDMAARTRLYGLRVAGHLARLGQVDGPPKRGTPSAAITNAAR